MEWRFLIIFTCILFACQTNGIAQMPECTFELDTLTGIKIITSVDEKPEFRGGESAMLTFFTNNLVWPQQGAFQATFLLEFVIDEYGKLVGPRICNKDLTALSVAEKEVLRVLKSMPAWVPAKCNGESVSTKVLLPLRF